MSLLAVVESAPAGGAATGELLLGTLAATIVMGAILVLGLGHRSGRITVLDRAGRGLERLTGLPGRVALPGAIALAAFTLAGVGFVWDVALHVDQGRDEGPFGTPAHYLMLAGIFGFVAAGWFALCMPRGEGRPSWVRLTRDWRAPPSAVAMLATAGFSTSGFPLDDLWHKAFGQDVTLWGPTHLMMITGGLLHFVALAMLVREARADTVGAAPPRLVRRALALVQAVTAGAIVLVGFTVAYQQEFAYGVPQFRLVFQPVLIAFTAGLVLVAMRLSLGPGGAVLTTIAGAGILGALTLIVGPVLGESTHHFPLYAAEAACVELAALVPFARRSGYRLAALAGVLIATVGVAAEWGWSHVWMPIAWPGHLLPEAMLRSVPIAIAGGVLGAFVAAGFAAAPRSAVLRPRAWAAPAGALAVVVASLAVLLPTTAPPLDARLALTEAAPAPQRTVHVTMRVSEQATRDADWVYAMAWQGKEHRAVAAPLRRLGPGLYRTTEPVPVHGTWKAGIRVHRGSAMRSVPVHMPADSAIPAPAVPARARMRRAFVGDHAFTQRERRDDVPGWLFGAASAAVAAMTLALAALLGWALVREARARGTLRPPRGRGAGAMTPTRRRRTAAIATVLAAGMLALAGAATAEAAPDPPPPGANDFSCRPSAEHPRPVVLVHGLGATMSANWSSLSPKLRAAGYCVFALTYGQDPRAALFPYSPGGVIAMERSAPELDAFVDRVLAATGAAEVDLLGHSEGTVMPRHYLERLGGAAEVRRFVALAPLWRGTQFLGAAMLRDLAGPMLSGPLRDLVARFCASCPQFLRGSPYLEGLNADGEAVPGVEHTNIVTRYDVLVVPYTSGIMRDGGTNIVVQDVCPANLSEHSTVAFDPAVAQLILNALDPERAAAVPC